jgi:hypothetical protein
LSSTWGSLQEIAALFFPLHRLVSFDCEWLAVVENFLYFVLVIGKKLALNHLGHDHTGVDY